MTSFCRCCLAEETDMLYLFTILSEFHSSASELIADCCGVMILENDCFSKDICKKCLQELIGAARFRRLCLQTEGKLQEKLDVKDPLTSCLAEYPETSDDPAIKDTGIKAETVDNYAGEIEDCTVKNSFEANDEIVECILRDIPTEPADSSINDKNYLGVKEDDEENVTHLELTHATGCCKFQCEFCDQGFNDRNHFVQHRRVHTGEKPHSCNICGKSFAQKSHAKQHVQCHAGKKMRFGCDICGKMFRLKLHLETHLRIHSGERPYKCDICNKEYASNGTLRYHLENHHRSSARFELSDSPEEDRNNCGEKQQDTSSVLEETPEKCEPVKKKRFRKDRDPRPHKCEFCGKGFINSNHLVQHRRIHTGERPHQCKTCGKAYAQKSHLTAHMRHHTGDYNFKCDQCGKGFLYTAELATHSRSHTGERPHKCEICQKDFVQKSALTQHLRSHSGERLHQCELCGKGFVRPGHLAQHMSMHTGQRMFKCTVCSKEFSRNGYLTQHMLIHGGELNHKCALCGKAFLSKSYLSQHMRFHSDSRPYKCEGCGKGFINRCHLKRHVRTHTGEQVA
ncbi:zinc finger protein 436-like isoform X2 [Wyeomyia smithii]|nr:zinc finger protein 436-like isoform X2 [Wyeomyia smithii]